MFPLKLVFGFAKGFVDEFVTNLISISKKVLFFGTSGFSFA